MKCSSCGNESSTTAQITAVKGEPGDPATEVINRVAAIAKLPVCLDCFEQLGKHGLCTSAEDFGGVMVQCTSWDGHGGPVHRNPVKMAEWRNTEAGGTASAQRIPAEEEDEDVPFTKARPLLKLSARVLSRAWINCFLAASEDEGRVALYQSLSLEFYRTGLNIVGCDGHLLFRSWVPTLDEIKAPDLYELPMHSFVVMDPDGFGLGFMRSLFSITGDEEHAGEMVSITTAPQDDAMQPSLGEEFISNRVIIRACGQRIDLRLYEDVYPNWRHLELGVDKRERVDSMTLATRTLGLIGKLKGVVSVDLEFNGKQKFIGFAARGETTVDGVLMPMAKREEKKEKGEG